MSSSFELVEETPPVSSSTLSTSFSFDDKPFLVDDASPVGVSLLEPAANMNPELELDAPAPK